MVGSPPASAPRARRVHIGHVLLLAFALRALLALSALAVTRDLGIFHSLDTDSYIDGARSLATSGRFVIGGLYEIVRTPGYPLVLVPGVWLGQLELVGVALQIAISCLTVYLVYRVALLLYGLESAALWAALLYAVEPLSVLFASKILTETLFTALVALFLYCVLRYYQERSLPYLIGAALAVAASTFVRPINLYFPVVVAAVLLLWALVAIRKEPRRLLAPVLFLVLSVLPVGLWQVRNADLASYNGFSAISDVNWYFYQGAAVTATLEGVPYYTVQDRLGYGDRKIYFASHPEQAAWPPGKVYEYMGKEGRRIVFSHVPLYASIHLKGIFKTLTNPGGVEYLKMYNLYPEAGGDFGVAVNAGIGETLRYLFTSNPLLLAVNLLFAGLLLVYYLAALAGLLSRQTLSAGALTVLATGLYLLVMSGGPQSLSRFRHPVMPVLCMLGGYGLYVLLSRLSYKPKGVG